MKIHVALVVAALCAGAVAAREAPAAARGAAPKAAPAAKAAPGAKKEEPPKIEGQEISRGERGFLGVEIKDSKFVIRFYDKEKKPMKPDVSRIALRWDPRYKVGMERVLLTPGPEDTLTSPRTIRPPYNFKLFIVLLQDVAEGEDAAGETHVIDLRQ